MPIGDLSMPTMVLEGGSAVGLVDEKREEKENKDGESIRAGGVHRHRAKTVKSLGYVSGHRSPL